MIVGFLCGAGAVGLLGAEMVMRPDPLRFMGWLLMQWGALMLFLTVVSLLWVLLMALARQVRD